MISSFFLLRFLCHLGKAKLRLIAEASQALPVSHPPIAADISYISHTQGGEYIVFRGCILVLLNAFCP